MFFNDRFYKFASDERGGERDTLTTLLILALIILPLVLLLIFFGERIKDVVQNEWDKVIGS